MGLGMATLDKHADDQNWNTVGGRKRLTEGDKPHQMQAAQSIPPEAPSKGSFADGHNTNIATPKYPGGGGTGV